MFFVGILLLSLICFVIFDYYKLIIMAHKQCCRSRYYLLFLMALMILFASCSQKQEKVLSGPNKTNEKGYTDPLTYTPGVDTVALPVVISTHTRPKSRYFNVPVKSGGSYTVHYPEGSVKHIDLQPPVTVLLPIVTTLLAEKDVEDEKFQPARGNGFFSTFTTENGLARDMISCGFKDQFGNLWFGTLGAGVSRYDGKSFTNFTTSQGLANNTVWSITEDRSGNLWFGTHGGGVSRYDGRSFTTFTSSQGLANNNVWVIKEDQRGNLWFGSLDGGVSRFDGKTFTTFTTSQGLADNNVKTITEDRNGNLWFGTLGGGISRFDGEAFTSFNTSHGLANNNVRAIIEDQNGNLWIGTKGGGISCFDGKTFMNFNTSHGLVNDNVRTITEDQSGNLWIGTSGGGVSCYNGKSFTNFTTLQGLANNDVFSITEDQSGSLWFGTYGGGVSHYYRKSFTKFTRAQGLANNIIWSIAEDNSGNLWFGTFGGGVSCYDGKSFTNFTTSQGLANNNVLSITEDQNGGLWFGTHGGGVSRYYGKSFTNFSSLQGLASNIVLSIKEDQRGNLWFGTLGGGVSCFDGKSFTNFTTSQGLANNNVRVITEDQYGNLWFGTEGGGVSRYDGKSFTNFTTSQGLGNNTIWSITEDQMGNLWFGTDGGGLSRYDGSTFENFTTQDGLPDNCITQIVIYNEEMLIGSNAGVANLLHFSLKNGQSNAEGLDAQNKIDNLLPQNDISNKELSKYAPVFKIYNFATGYPVKDVNVGQNTLYFDATGVIWVATGSDKTSLLRIDYDAFQKNENSPKVILQNLKVNNENISWYNLKYQSESSKADKLAIINEEILTFGRQLNEMLRDTMRQKFSDIEFEDITRFYPLPKNLVLPHKLNHVTFEFAAVAPARPNLIKYQYMLEGYDDGWSPIAQKTSASFGNIFEGTYTFKLKARSSDGIWSEPISYTFEVLPPWWRSWWMYVIYSIVFIGGLYLLYRWRLASLRREKETLELKVKVRTKEIQNQKVEIEQKNEELRASEEGLQAANEELTAINEELYYKNEEINQTNAELKATLQHLKDTQSQLLQSEKMASLGVLTSGVAHEINNPLNYIMCAHMGFENYFEENNLIEDEVISELLDNLKEGVERASAIVQGLNQFSRASDSDTEECHLHSIIDNCLVMLNNKLKHRIEVEKNYYKEDLIIMGNVGKLHQAFINILSNAMQAIPEKGQIIINTKNENNTAIIEISDNGSGISEEDLSKITDPFFTTKDPGEGTGLGLSITYNIIHKHGGKLKFDSTEGKGTTVTVSLPIDSASR
jgi:signal transduction histidine kinase/streptogramin lyase